MKMKMKIRASQIEANVIKNLETMIDNNKWLFDNEQIVLMADAHSGDVAPIGYTQTISNAESWVSPELVGRDIGCGVTSYLLDGVLSKSELEEINAFIVKNIAVNENNQSKYAFEYGASFATLGGNNHFIEIGEHVGQTLLSVHSGSRAYGAAVHEHYSYDERDIEYQNERMFLICELLANDRADELDARLKQFDEGYEKSSIAVVKGWNGYFKDMLQAVEWASASRKVMLDEILFFMQSRNMNIAFNRVIESIHNYIDLSQKTQILRKGSTSATHGSEVVIPLNMRDGIILGKAASTSEMNYSLPHGAGRKMSRTQAKSELNIETYREMMKDVVTTSVAESTLGEHPDAYKNTQVILNDIEPYLSNYAIFKTVMNYRSA